MVSHKNIGGSKFHSPGPFLIEEYVPGGPYLIAIFGPGVHIVMGPYFILHRYCNKFTDLSNIKPIILAPDNRAGAHYMCKCTGRCPTISLAQASSQVNGAEKCFYDEDCLVG